MGVGLCPGRGRVSVTASHAHMVMSGQYASYWKAFLYLSNSYLIYLDHIWLYCTCPVCDSVEL